MLTKKTSDDAEILFLFKTFSASIITIIITCILSADIKAQVLKTESTKLNGEKVLKLFSPYRNNIYWVIAGKYLDENALTLIVSHRHATGICNGKLIVTKTKVAFKSQELPQHNFLYERSGLKDFAVKPWKSFGKTIYEQISVKTKEKDYNFYPLADSYVYNSQELDFPHILYWFTDAIINFDKAWVRFEQEYNGNLNSEEVISFSGQKYTIAEYYDKFKDQTAYSTSWMTVPGIGEILIWFVSEGKAKSKPEYFQLLVAYPQSIDRLLKYDKSVIFLIDNQRIKLANTELVDVKNSHYANLRGARTSTIVVGTSIPFDVLQAIASGKNVEFQVETSEGKLDSDQKEMLNRLILMTKND